jgi:hypothetical protein
MNITLPDCLLATVIALQGWILLEIISLKVKLAATVQRIDDLPCKGCEPK